MRSFDTIVSAVLQVVNANPALAAKHQWPRDQRGVENWVDLYNATLCAKMGWTEYILTEKDASIPKPSAPHQQQMLQSLRAAAVVAKELVAGAKTLTEWIDSGAPAVPAEQALHRALICSQCPKNEEGDFTKWFTVPASELIRRQLDKARTRNLSTPRDDALNLCTACHCPLKLKVHVPLDWITKRLSDEQKAKLREGKDCWILAESPA